MRAVATAAAPRARQRCHGSPRRLRPVRPWPGPPRPPRRPSAGKVSRSMGTPWTMAGCPRSPGTNRISTGSSSAGARMSPWTDWRPISGRGISLRAATWRPGLPLAGHRCEA
eukprot:6428486-Alexandrium_andersonii.AAC.1